MDAPLVTAWQPQVRARYERRPDAPNFPRRVSREPPTAVGRLWAAPGKRVASYVYALLLPYDVAWV